MKKFFLFLFFLVPFFCFSQRELLPSFIRDSMDAYILNGLKDWKIPGLSVAIVKDSKIIHLKGYGTLEQGGKVSVDENTVFMIGSNTKAFTATVLTMLEDEKKLSLDDKVIKWLPEFRLQDPLATRETTIRDLLCHRIGFETFQGDFTYWTSRLTRAEVIKKMALIDPVYGFRTTYGYCNAAFLTAGELIPKITGKSWEQTVAEKIVNPLKMSRTIMLSADLSKMQNAAIPHTLVNSELIKLPFPLIDNLAPAASMSSSAKDMCNWLIAQLDSGRFESKKIIQEEALFATRVPQTIVRMDPRHNVKSHFYLYGLGFLISDRSGKIVISHTGGVDGFLSSLVMVPEERLGIVVLTNSDQNSFFQSLSNEIRDAFLGLPYHNFSKLALENFQKEESDSRNLLDSLKNIISKKNKLPFEMRNYLGTYTNKVYGDIEVRPENSTLTIFFPNHPGLTGKLEHVQDNSFLCTYSNPTMGIKEIYFKEVNGKITGLSLRVADFVEFLPYEFVKKN